MIYLFFQTWIWILLAGLLGLFIGWLIWGRACSELREQLDQCHGQLRRAESSAEAATLSASMESASDYSASSTASAADTALHGEEDEVVEEVRDDWRPAALESPEGSADDLKRIKGVGPVIEKTLNELGIYHFRQVADFTDDNVKWVDNYISFPGRIRREQWVDQAADLADGRATEFASRYDRGETGGRR